MVRLLIIGLDGATYRVIRRFKHLLPTFKYLIKKSEYGVLKSITGINTRVPRTGPAWASLYTGLRPEEHGMTEDKWIKDVYVYDCIKKVTIWDLIQEEYSLGMMTMPITYPAFELNGWIISGFPASKTFNNWYYPASLGRFIEESFSIDYVDYVYVELTKWRKKFDKEKQNQITLQKIRKLKEISKVYNTEVMAIGLTLLDRYGHAYPQYRNKYLSYIQDSILRYAPNKVICSSLTEMFNEFTNLVDDKLIKFNGSLLGGYKKADEYIKMLIDYFKPQNLVICSDHGFKKYGALYNSDHDMNGFYLLKGDNYKEGVEKKRDILEISSNILEILDISTKRLGKDKNREQISSLDSRSKKKIMKKLRALGYMG